MEIYHTHQEANITSICSSYFEVKMENSSSFFHPHITFFCLNKTVCGQQQMVVATFFYSLPFQLLYQHFYQYQELLHRATRSRMEFLFLQFCLLTSTISLQHLGRMKKSSLSLSTCRFMHYSTYI